jgi:hypothetical protein
MQTVHIEKYPNGAKRMDVVYISDVVNVRKTVQVGQLQTALSEVEALEQIVGQAKQPVEVEAALRSTHGGKNSLVALLGQLDQDSRLRFLKRLCMVLRHETDPVLQEHMACEANSFQQEGPVFCHAADPRLQPVLTGITRGRLEALRNKVQLFMGRGTLEQVEGMLSRIVSQEPQPILCMWDGQEYDSFFPYRPLRKAAGRWQNSCSEPMPYEHSSVSKTDKFSDKCIQSTN